MLQSNQKAPDGFRELQTCLECFKVLSSASECFKVIQSAPERSRAIQSSVNVKRLTGLRVFSCAKLWPLQKMQKNDTTSVKFIRRLCKKPTKLASTASEAAIVVIGFTFHFEGRMRVRPRSRALLLQKSVDDESSSSKFMHRRDESAMTE